MLDPARVVAEVAGGHRGVGRRHTVWDPHSQAGYRRVERGKQVTKEGRSVLRGGFLRGLFCRPRNLL